MHLHLFKDNSISSTLERDFGNLKRNSPGLVDKNKFKDVLLSNGLEEYLDSCLSPNREYKNILGANIDSHYYVEYFGFSNNSRRYIMTIDFSQCLDLALSLLTGCDPASFRNMVDYEKISEAILTLDTQNLDIPIQSFTAVDPKVTSFLIDLANKNTTEFTFIRALLSSILATMSKILKYVAFSLQRNTPAIVRSISKQSIVLTTYKEFTDNLLELEYTCSDNNEYKYSLSICQKLKGGEE